ncbi:MAG TPA: hypothetical protein VHP82_07505 [Gaiellaceae bacterium]|jgi:hypothetical protein|nr:hypothetical protein [Gaiellaceae bacterium]
MPRRAAIGLAALWMLATVGIAGAHAAPRTTASPALRTAGPFMLDDIRIKVEGNWDLAWQTLYPAHKVVARRSVYVACETSTPWPAPVESVALVGVHRASFRVPGGGVVDGAAVAVRIAVKWYRERDPLTFTHVFHVVPVNGHWTWLLSPQRYALYRHDGCGNFPVA